MVQANPPSIRGTKEGGGRGAGAPSADLASGTEIARYPGARSGEREKKQHLKQNY